jgi:hypothetical protein
LNRRSRLITRRCCTVAATIARMPVSTKDTATSRTESWAWAGSELALLRIAAMILSRPKPKLISERQVRIQAIRVRSAAARLRSLASSSVMPMPLEASDGVLRRA